MSAMADTVTAPDRAVAAPARFATAVDDGVLAELFVCMHEGDAGALEALYDATARVLYGLALWRTGSPDDAADIVQEVFVRLARHRDRLADVRAPRAWLLSVTHRLAVDVGRRRARRRESPADGLELLRAPVDDPGRAIDAARASALLAALPPAQREAVYLRHYQDLGFAAIGRVTGVPTFTAASRYRLGVVKLRRLMERGS
jgi:RNA polymerase sigma-70 factor (ECF subfamily)